MATSNSKEQARVKASYDAYKKTQMAKEKAAYAAKKQKAAQQTKATAAALYATTQPKAPAKKSVVETGKSYYAKDTKKPAAKVTKPIVPAKPVFDPKLPVTKTKPKAKDTGYGARTKEVIKYMNPSNIKTTASKPATKAPTKTPAKATTASKPTVTKTTAAPAKTVSQVWAEKTGTSWSEAKKLGLTTGSAKDNMALLSRLNSGSVDKGTIATMKDNSKVPTLTATKVTTTTTAPAAIASTGSKSQTAGSGIGAMEREQGMYKKGGPVQKASLGAIVKGVKSMFGMGAKVAKGTKKVAKTVKKAAKTYGDNGSYNRLSDMKKSEFYRDRHNAGKVYNAAGSNKGQAIATGAAVVGLGAAAIAQKKAKGKSTIKKK